MGLRTKIKQRLRRVMKQWTGEHSESAPEHIERFERDLGEDPDREVVMARLNRPKTTK